MAFVNWIGKPPERPAPEICREQTHPGFCLADLDKDAPPDSAFAKKAPQMAPDAEFLATACLPRLPIG